MPLAYSAPTPIASQYSAFTNWLPIIIIASLLATLLAGVYYMIGYLLNNSRIKGSAITEFEQALGSIALVVIIIGVLYMIGTSDISFSTILGSNGASQISSICTTYLSNSQVNLLKSQYTQPSQSNPNENLPEPTTAICQNLIGPTGPKSGITSHIDYGLASMYVIIANMTNQSTMELNAMYNFDSLVFFLRNLNPFIGFCMPGICVNPLEPNIEPNFELSYKPYSGYVLQRLIAPSIVIQATTTIYMEIIELSVIIILLIGWPYLLAAGIILRTIPFTRRAGGLIIAATVAGIILLPTIYLIEYGALYNLQSQPFIGSSLIPGMALCGFGQVSGSGSNSVLFCYTSATKLQTSYIYKGLQPLGYPQTLSSCKTVADGTLPQTQSTSRNPKTLQPIPGPQSNPFNVQPPCYVKKDLSFYIFPSAADIINFYSCYPSAPNILVPTEAEILGSTVADNFVMPFSFIFSLFSSNSANTQASSLLSPFYGYSGGSCMAKVGPHNLVAAYTALVNMYGLITVSGFILPIINLLMMISAMTGLSSMIGGETTIMGLSRFI
ncbi:MAG: hypothetical protein ACYCO0_01555 [Candidatus Micrarchaeaceae archaeon]